MSWNMFFSKTPDHYQFNTKTNYIVINLMVMVLFCKKPITVTMVVSINFCPNDTAHCRFLRIGWPNCVGHRTMKSQWYIGSNDKKSSRGMSSVHSWMITGSSISARRPHQLKKWPYESAVSPSMSPAMLYAVHGVPAIWTLATLDFISQSLSCCKHQPFLSNALHGLHRMISQISHIKTIIKNNTNKWQTNKNTNSNNIHSIVKQDSFALPYETRPMATNVFWTDHYFSIGPALLVLEVEKIAICLQRCM